ncbi:MAG TPA: thiol-disulfide oxidoreductase ResA [Nitrospina sp.]|jgi:peroxiredoxin|nr:TlpA disulfide reductase family protein [Nitrospinaceae bacterium]MDP7148867.1 TlpA disulfide reductase family protein [Nitrospinaceae bacterium]HAX46930.1 thiol-disulfide oxidoreductase ResA [Nitrospina sp.]|tara:strand:+ start:1135 stop:1653 length:519 start_codon:yes stop_codon:yes gene_type:complete
MPQFSLSRFVIALVLMLAITASFSQVEAVEKSHLAQDFTLKNLDGEEVNLSQFRGKYLLINFWATWCGPCKIEMPSLETLYRRFKSDKFDMIGISNDMFGDRVVRPYVKASKLTFPMLLDQRMIVSHQYGVVSLPTTFLIDPQGKIIGVLQGAEDWSDPGTLLYFENLLKKS